MKNSQHIYGYDEDALIKAASQDSLEDFNQLVLKYQGMAYHHARALLGDPDLAEDVTQESFIKAFRNLRSFRGGSLRSWLLRIVTNSAYDLLRTSRKHPSQPLFPEDEHGEEIDVAPWLEDPVASVQDTVEQSELSQALYRMLDELPDAFRDVLTLIDVHEFDYAEAAQSLNIPIGTVKSRLARARLYMQKKIRNYMGPGYPPACVAPDLSASFQGDINPQ